MKRYSLKFAISTLVSGLILVSVLSIAGALYYGTRRALFLTTNEMMGQISHSMADKLSRRLDQIERLNTLIADLILSGKLKPADEENFTGFLQDALKATPSAAFIDCAVPAGHKYQARRMPDGSLSRRIVHRSSSRVTSIWHHQNPAYARTEQDTVADLASGYDPRTKPLWKAGVEGGKMVWTEVHGSVSGLNYSNVNPVFDAKGGLVCVLSIDMKVADLSAFLNAFRIGSTGKAFIIDKDFRVVAMSMASDKDLERMRQGAGDESGPVEFDDPNIRHALRRFRKSPQMGGREFLAFHDPAGRRMLASFEPEPVYKFTFGVVVPEEEILGSIKHTFNLTLAMTALFLVAALAVAYGISRSISRPLASLAGEVDRIRRLDLGDGPPLVTLIEEVARIDHSIQNMKKGLRSFKKYVPSEVVVRLMDLQKEAVIEGENRDLTIFFSDIANFTDISERLTPERLVEMLGVYFETTTRILLDQSGTVDKFIGDAIMGFWGAPNPMADHALRACRSALLVQEGLGRLNARWTSEGQEAFPTRIGLNTGPAIVGNIGYEGRMNYTAIGDSVNLASRLEGLNKFYRTRILVSEATFLAAGDGILARKVDRVTVKGKREAVPIFELLAMRAEAAPGLVAEAEAFDAAFALYEGQRWAEALEALAGLAGPEDGPRRVLAERCRFFLASPPGADWDGVFRHHEK